MMSRSAETLMQAGLSNIPADWDVVTIGQLLSKDRGISVGVMYPGTDDPSGIPLIRAGDLSGHKINPNPEFHISKEKHIEYSRTALKGGELLLSLVGNLGQCAVATETITGWNAARAIAVIRLADKLDADYVRLCLMSEPLQYLMNAWSTTTVQATLNLKEIKELPIPWPPKKERSEIAISLKSLEDKIDVNHRMNATLEAMARTVFHQWFVKNDEAKNWEIQTLLQHVEAEKGLSYKGEGLSKDSGVPMHNLNSVYEGGGYKYEGIKYYTGEYRERHILRAGDIIVTNTEQGFEYLLIGYPAIVPKHFGETGIFSHHIFRVRPLSKSPVKTHYLYFLLMNPYVRDQIIGCTNGTTVNMLSADGLRTPKFHLPPKQLIDKFEQFAAPIFEKMELIYEESRTLANLRDSLLPKLMRGEVRVRDVED